MRLARKGPGDYVSLDGSIRVQEGSGKPPYSWRAFDRSGATLAHGESLREVRRKLDRQSDGVTDLCRRFAAAADAGDPWDSGRLGQEIRAMLAKRDARTNAAKGHA